LFRTAASVFHPEPDKSLHAPITFLEGPSSCYLPVYWLAAARLVEAQRYKPEGRGFESRWRHLLNPSGRNMALGSTQPATELSTRDVFWEVKPVGA
jgi:hypothetical protein